MAEVRNIDTRERILDAAERLFMAHGYEGTSMRQITGDAAVNLAAVNYHFGSKESLMQEGSFSMGRRMPMQGWPESSVKKRVRSRRGMWTWGGLVRWQT